MHTMNKKQLQEAIRTHLSQGRPKHEVFRMMSGQGASDRVVAHAIASHASPERLRLHARLIDAMIVISWLQMAVALGIGVLMGIGMHAGWIALLVITAFLGCITYLFVWGFTHNRAWAYNVSILLSIINLPKALGDMGQAPVANGISLLLGVALIAFTWFVRSKLFPDFAFVGPRKVKGSYVFVD
jgi:hypothetical protein